jgi:hypothetical protein
VLVYLVIGSLAGATLIGFLGGLFLFKLKQRWCPACGTTLNCPACLGPGAHRLPGARP